jgi:GNAT superfamily N-acetyltransferase
MAYDTKLADRKRLKIKTARLDGAAEITGILQETFAEYESLYTPEAFAMITLSADEIKKRFSEAGKIWVAMLDGKIVGTVSAVHRNESLYIRSLAILPAAQGLRIGERLLTEIENYAVADGYKILTLSTGEFLHRAVRHTKDWGSALREVLISTAPG